MLNFFFLLLNLGTTLVFAAFSLLKLLFAALFGMYFLQSKKKKTFEENISLINKRKINVFFFFFLERTREKKKE